MKNSEVIASHSGARWPVALFAFVLLLTVPRVFIAPGGSRWGWLTISLINVLFIVRGLSVGRVRLTPTHLEVRTVLGTSRFPCSDIRAVSVRCTRIGVAGVARDALAIETTTGVTVISDVNVASGSGLLDPICAKVNARVGETG